MTTEQVDARPVLATALVTAIDHVGIAVPDLEAAKKWYHDNLGMIVLHEEVNDEQGIVEAMLSVRGAPVGSRATPADGPDRRFVDHRQVPRHPWPRDAAAGLPHQ